MLSIIKGKGFKVLYLVLMGFIVLTGITLSDLSCSSGGSGSNGSLTQMLYVLNSDGSVSVINPSAGTTVTTLSVGGSAHIASLANGSYLNEFGINPAILNPLQISTPSISAFQGVYGIAANPNTHKVYVVTGSNTVSVIDTTTNKVVTTINVPAGAFGIAVNPATNLAYVGNSSPSQGIVTVIDLSTNSVVTTINTQSALPLADVIVNPVQGGDVYVSGWASGIIDDINTTSNQVAYSWPGTASKYPIGLALDPTHNLLYTSTYLGNLEISDVSPSALKGGNYIKAVYPIAPNDTCPGIAINTQANVVYMTDNPGGKLYVINASNGSILSTINIGGNPQAVSYDPSTNNIYVVCDGNCPGLTTVNASTNTVTNTINTPPGTTPVGIITTPGSPSVGSTSGGNSCTTNAQCLNGQVCTNGSCVASTSCTSNAQCSSGQICQNGSCVTQSTSGTEFTYPVGTGPQGIAIDASGNAWVVNSGSNSVTKLNSSGTPIGTYPVGNGPGGIAIDASGHVWVTNNNDNTVTELSSTGTTIATYLVGPVGEALWGIAIDASGHVWAENHSSATVRELSSTGITIGTYAVGSSPEGIAIDTSGNVWVANRSSANVTKLNSFGTTVGTYPVGNGPEGIAIDASGHVWVAQNDDNTITELSSTGITIGTYLVGNWPRCIALDASGNVWVTNMYSNTVTELNSSGTIIGTYAVGTTPVGIAIDSSGNVWVTNGGDNTVTEIAGITKGPQYFPFTGPQFPGGNL